MSKWAGKYVIGLTGNIGTGKSVVRRMLEHLGALGIDADSFSHRAIAKGAPGYDQVIRTFGEWILDPQGEIDRARLGRVVFSDPQALSQLEAIIHPLVIQAIDWVITHSKKPVVVIEAIKLLEANIHKSCDSIWVVVAPPELQMARLVQRRKMDEAEARRRIKAQPPQHAKAAAANVIINNAGSIEDTWRKVSAAWKKHIPAGASPATLEPVSATQGALSVARAQPRDSKMIADFINRVHTSGTVTASDVMADFGDKAYLMLHSGNRLVGLAGWQVENLVARTNSIIIDPSLLPDQALPPLVTEMERASKDLQCEASLIFTADRFSTDALWQSMGYERRTAQSLRVAIWQEAARETAEPGQILYFKQLRQDRVLRPI